MRTTKEDEEMIRRRDDSLLRKIAIGVTVAIVIQAVFSIYYAGSLANQVTNNTEALGLMAKKFEAQSNIAVTLERVRTLVEGMTTDVTRTVNKLDTVASEQARRGPIVDRAERHLKKVDD